MKKINGNAARASAWLGTPPVHCDICGRTLSNSGIFVDGKTRQGPWAIMCTHCHSSRGVGLGVGKGQKYVMEAAVGDGEKPVWVQVTSA